MTSRQAAAIAIAWEENLSLRFDIASSARYFAAVLPLLRSAVPDLGAREISSALRGDS
jgi:hypothetical protein